MSAFSDLFNTVAHPASTPEQIKAANDNFTHEQRGRQEERASRLVADCLVTHNISDKNRYNVRLPREDGESNTAWRTRTQEKANAISRVMNGVAKVSASKGRITVQTEPNSQANWKLRFRNLHIECQRFEQK